jgi:hypothetical protein
MKLHPDAIPKKELEPQLECENLQEFLEQLIESEGWNKKLRVRHVSHSSLWQIIDFRDLDLGLEASIIITESLENFKQGKVTRAWVRKECVEFLNDVESFDRYSN